MDVFIVVIDCGWDGDDVLAVFSSLNEAEKYAEAIERDTEAADSPLYTSIYPMRLDDRVVLDLMKPKRQYHRHAGEWVS